MDDGSGPQIPYLPIAPVVAETPGQAKRMFLTEFTRRPGSGVYGDDWNELRVRLLLRDVDVAAGIHEDDARFWVRIHELEDHGGGRCGCPDVDL